MLVGKQVILRGFDLSDAPTILEHFNDLEVRQFMDTPAPHSKEQEEQWIRRTWEARRAGRGHFFAIEQKKPKRLIGSCGLFNISKTHRNAELMIVIYDKRKWGKGLGTEALCLLLDFGFDILNFHRIFLYTHETNKRAQRVYDKLGFKMMGRRRQTSFYNGTYQNLLYYDLIANEYRQGGTQTK